MNYQQILDYLCYVRNKRIPGPSLYFKGYIDACTDSDWLTEEERDSLCRIFAINEVW